MYVSHYAVEFPLCRKCFFLQEDTQHLSTTHRSSASHVSLPRCQRCHEAATTCFTIPSFNKSSIGSRLRAASISSALATSPRPLVQRRDLRWFRWRMYSCKPAISDFTMSFACLEGSLYFVGVTTHGTVPRLEVQSTMSHDHQKESRKTSVFHVRCRPCACGNMQSRPRNMLDSHSSERRSCPWSKCIERSIHRIPPKPRGHESQEKTPF